MTEKLHFFKLSGSGNDFIVFDNFKNRLSFDFFKNITPKVCHRNNGVGADGVIVLNEEAGVDFRWDFFNSDGSVAEMCGNGSRCAARLFSHLNGINEIKFLTLAGLIRATVNGDMVKVKLSEPTNLVPDMELYLNGEMVKGNFVNTGVPHFVVITEQLSQINVKELGNKVRFHERFKPAGTNVNFVQCEGETSINVRTYERGVEDETLACGTGACASAVICGYKGFVKSPVTVTTTGGEKLNIYFDINGERISNLYLEGKVRFICEGDIYLSEIQN